MKTSAALVVTASTLTLCLVLGGGCKTAERKALENINKDWNRVIRASHIYPIYPLSQDVQPGDIFLTKTHMEDASAWNAPGYLPFDHHITRLYPTNYSQFYVQSFDLGDGQPLPKQWLSANTWEDAPLAAFPSYSFAVKQGGGASVSLPIQGIPVGLSLMGAKDASGTVTIADSHTYGVDELSLQQQVMDYLNDNMDDIFRYVAPSKTDTNGYFLQVVSRVYTTGRVAVSMHNDTAFGANISGGAPKDVPIPNLGTNAAENYTALVNAVNNVVNPSDAKTIMPGGTLKFTHVSSRSVSMEETFPKPLVIGYVGFSVHIGNAADYFKLHPAREEILRSETRKAVSDISISTSSPTNSLSANDRSAVEAALGALDAIQAGPIPVCDETKTRNAAVKKLHELSRVRTLPEPARHSVTNAIKRFREIPMFRPSVRVESLEAAEKKLKR